MCILFSRWSYCQYDNGTNSARVEIRQLTEEIKKLEKSNPHVYYAENDKSNVNIKKNLRNTLIAHKFMCPFHRGFYYIIYDGLPVCTGYKDDYTNRYRPCKAMKHYEEWNRLKSKVEETQEIEAEIKAKKERLAELQSQISNPVTSRRHTTEYDVKTFADTPSTPKVIKVRRSTIDKLLKEGEVSNSRITLILVDD